jgi:hypothetical protein
MWRSLRNIIDSFWTYIDLSPNLQVRRQVKRSLRDRPCLSASDWHEQCWQPFAISRPISDFVYDRMQEYSGLEFGRIRPADHLNDDLHLPVICWFDWQMTLREDFLQCFHIDLGDRFHSLPLDTVQDLVLLLNHQLLPINPSP